MDKERAGFHYCVGKKQGDDKYYMSKVFVDVIGKLVDLCNYSHNFDYCLIFVFSNSYSLGRTYYFKLFLKFWSQHIVSYSYQRLRNYQNLRGLNAVL